MSFRIAPTLAVAGLALLAACSRAPVEDTSSTIIVAPEPISIEPVYQGKYK